MLGIPAEAAAVLAAKLSDASLTQQIKEAATSAGTQALQMLMQNASTMFGKKG